MTSEKDGNIPKNKSKLFNSTGTYFGSKMDSSKRKEGGKVLTFKREPRFDVYIDERNRSLPGPGNYDKEEKNLNGG